MKKYGLLLLGLCLMLQTYGLDGILIKSIDYSLKEKWGNTLGKTAPRISTCSEVFKGQHLYLAPATTGYKTDADGISDIVYSLRIVKPDGSVFFEKNDLLLRRDRVPNKDYVQMAVEMTDIQFQEKDVFGIYQIEVNIKDNVSGDSKKIEDEIALIELPPYNKHLVKDDNDYGEWMHNYYRSPRPENALAYYIHYIESEMSDDDDKFYIMFSTFLEIFKNNKFLAQQVTDCYQTQDLRARIFLLYLLYQADLGSEEFYTKLEGDEKETYQSLKESPKIDIYAPIEHPSQLDMLWATFFSSGSYKPILQLIKTLDYVKYQGFLNKFKDSPQTEDDRQKALYDAIYQAVVWSMGSNREQHELVTNYCNWAYEYEPLSDTQKEELRKIISE